MTCIFNDCVLLQYGVRGHAVDDPSFCAHPFVGTVDDQARRLNPK